MTPLFVRVAVAERTETSVGLISVID